MNYRVIRKIDNLGRVVIPKDIRLALNLKAGDSIEMISNDKEVTISKSHETIASNYYYSLLSKEGQALLNDSVVYERLTQIANTVNSTPAEYLYRFEEKLSNSPEEIFSILKEI